MKHSNLYTPMSSRLLPEVLQLFFERLQREISSKRFLTARLASLYRLLGTLKCCKAYSIIE